MHAATIVVGDKLCLYKSLAGGPLSAEELARKTETDARYVREWLSAQAASGYVEYDAATDTFGLTEEQAFALAVEPGVHSRSIRCCGCAIQGDPEHDIGISHRSWVPLAPA
jgi:hypothetical protein